MNDQLLKEQKTNRENQHYYKQAGRQLVRSLLTICDIGVSSHPWAYVDNK